MFAFESFSEFIAMAGHGPYVWTAYAICFVVLVAVLIVPVRAYRRQLRLIKQQAGLQSSNRSVDG